MEYSVYSDMIYGKEGGKVTKNLKCDIKSKFSGNVNTLDEESPHPGISIVLERINSNEGI